MSDQSSPPHMRIRSLDGFGQSDNGNNICIACTDQRNEKVVISIPHVFESSFLMHFQGAAQTAAKKRGASAEPDTLNALRVDDIQFGVADDGKLAIILNLANGTILNLALNSNVQKLLREALDLVDAYHTQGGPSRQQ